MADQIEQQPMPEAGGVRFFTIVQYAGFRALDGGSFEVSLVTDTGLRVELQLDDFTFCDLANGVSKAMRQREP